MTKSKYDDETKPSPVSGPPRPDTLARLSEIVHNWDERHPGERRALPKHPQEAAKQWVHYQEPPGRGEAPNLKTDPGGKKYWLTPFMDRLARNLHLFLCHNFENQNYIVAAAEAGIPWRGDPMTHFRLIVDEHERMTEIGVEQYLLNRSLSDTVADAETSTTMES